MPQAAEWVIVVQIQKNPKSSLQICRVEQQIALPAGNDRGPPRRWRRTAKPSKLGRRSLPRGKESAGRAGIKPYD